MAEAVESHCYHLCSYDGMNNATVQDLLLCSFSFRQIAACAISTYTPYIFPTISVRTFLSEFPSHIIFTVLHGMQTRSSDENSVRLSVCLFIKRLARDKTKEKSVQIFIPYERSFILVF